MQSTIWPSDGQHFAVCPKLCLQSLEVMLGHGGCAMAVDIVSIERKKAVYSNVNFTHQTGFYALANHGSLLARDGQHVGFFSWQDFFAESDIQVLRGPVTVP